MKVDIKNLDNNKIGSVELTDSIFSLPLRTDIIARMVNYQLAKRRAGTHKARGISEISGTTKKPFRQKGTGRARQGSLRSPQMRGGACIFGPVVRSHAIDLPKKVRRLALKTALSAKAQEGKLIVLENLVLSDAKTRTLKERLNTMGLGSVLFIDGAQVNENFARASANLFEIDMLPQQGINVYDILKRDTLVLTKAALEYLEERLK